MREKSRTVDYDIPTFIFFWKVEWDALYSDAPLNLLMTSCRKAAKYDWLPRTTILFVRTTAIRWPFRQVPAALRHPLLKKQKVGE